MSEAIANRPVALLKVQEARALLAQCTKVDEAKGIRDKAAAIQAYLRQQKASAEALDDAAEIKKRAEVRIGELLIDQKARGQRDTGKGGDRRSRSLDVIVKPPTLRQLGIELKESSTFQRLAGIPDDFFESYIKRQRADPLGEITTAGLLREYAEVTISRRRTQKLADIADTDPVALGEVPDCPVLLADPPWRYEHVKTESRAIENQYPTMDLDAICALRPPAALNAVLFLWATSPKLEEALRVLNAWGFSYRTCAVWVKDKIGMGYWFRQQHELLLVGVRGELPPPPPEARVSSVITSERLEHSEKPEEVPELIERAYPTLPKVELFARQPRAGWHVWGNEVSA